MAKNTGNGYVTWTTRHAGIVAGKVVCGNRFQQMMGFLELEVGGLLFNRTFYTAYEAKKPSTVLKSH